MNKFTIAITLCFLTTVIYTQDNNLLLGKSTNMYTSAAFYDLSDPTGVNIEVNIWGFVKLPGKYKVPYNTTIMDLLSYSGGPTENSSLDDIRILRQNTDSSKGKLEVIKLNYNDLLWEDRILLSKKMNPQLKAGDFVIVPEERRYTIREDIGFYLPIITSLLTIATFIITLRK
jgi:hypothetical protein